MGLPETIRVKISSEAAEYIAITPVVVREMPVRELVESMLGIAGKDPARVRELLRRGSLVSGASRFRWEGWEADPAAIDALLATFPDPDPGRRFTTEHCVRVVLKGRDTRIEVSRETASGRRLFRRRSYWQALMEFAESAGMQYAGYSYRERADHFTAEVPAPAAARLRESAGAVKYSTLEAKIRRAHVELIEFCVERAG